MGLIERDARHVWHPFTQHAIEPAPLPVVRAEGATLVLEDGRELIDGISSWWTCLHGHGQPELVRAMSEQAATLDHVLFAGATHEPAVALSEELIEVAPAGLQRVFFSDNGSTSVEVALKIAYQAHAQAGAPERTVFVALEGGYHGDTFGSMSIGDPDPFFLPFRPLLFEARRAAPSGEAIEAALDELGERAAGVVMEPLVQGAGGMRMHGPEVVQAARRACDQRGLPLIADEVMVGFGRTGSALRLLVRQGSLRICCAWPKGSRAAAFPMSVTLSTEKLYEILPVPATGARAFFHGHSFTGNPVGCSVARASLRLCQAQDVPGRLDAIGRQIEGVLRERLPEGGRPRATLRRTGGIVAFDLDPDRSAGGGSGGYLAPRAIQLREAAARQGALLRPLGDVLYAMPPAAATPEQCRTLGQVMADLADASGGLERLPQIRDRPPGAASRRRRT